MKRPPRQSQPEPRVVALTRADEPAPFQLAPYRPQAAPTVVPVTAYLSRYNTPESQRAVYNGLRALGALLSGREVKDVKDPRVVPWHQLRYPHAQALRAKLMAHYKPATVNLYLCVLRGITAECKRQKLMSREDYDELAEVKSVKPGTDLAGRALTDVERKTLHAACDMTVSGRRDAVLLAMANGMGMRRSEVCSVDLSNWDSKRLHIPSKAAKGNKARTVVPSPRMREVIESWLKVRGSTPGPLVCAIDSAGKPQPTERITGGVLYHLLQKLVQKAGVQHVMPHDLRRDFCTRMLRKTGDVLAVSAMMGHSSSVTTARYDRRTEDDREKLMVLFDDE